MSFLQIEGLHPVDEKVDWPTLVIRQNDQKINLEGASLLPVHFLQAQFGQFIITQDLV